jgi:Peptidase M64 N-terminus
MSFKLKLMRGLMPNLTKMLAVSLLLVSQVVLAQQVATVRVDYLHSGNAKQDHYALDRVLIEPLPWPGNPKKTRDTTNHGVNLFQVRDKASGALLYSRGFSTVFAE